jgi:hypothetical protein
MLTGRLMGRIIAARGDPWGGRVCPWGGRVYPGDAGKERRFDTYCQR